MKLTIFGPTGGLGQALVAQALEQSHAVTAFTRSPEKLGRLQDRLRLIKGNVLDLSSVERAIQGQDAVLCALGASVTDKTQLRANGTANIIAAMEKTGVRRFVCVSALGVGESSTLLPFYYKYLIIPLIMRHLYADHEHQEYRIKNSPLDWVIVRPGNYTNGERTGLYRHGFTVADGPTKLKVSRADLAEFMLQQLTDDTYLHKTPCLSY